MRKISVITASDINRVHETVYRRSMELNCGFAVAVADSHGELVYFFKTDKSAASFVWIAQCKAFTAARDRQKSSSLAAASKEGGFSVTSLGDIRYTSLGGGVPVFDNGDCIGGVGVSGMTQKEDEELAEEIVKILLQEA